MQKSGGFVSDRKISLYQYIGFMLYYIVYEYTCFAAYERSVCIHVQSAYPPWTFV